MFPFIIIKSFVQSFSAFVKFTPCKNEESQVTGKVVFIDR